jgi:parallel beta-helix repeat protein
MEEPMIKMKTLLRTITIVAAGLIACLLAQTTQASTVQVGGCKTGLTNFMTIQAAVNAVPGGSTIFVCPGSYPEQVTINKNVTLNGVSFGNSNNPTVVPPIGGLVANTTDPAGSGAPVAAQIAVISPATSVIIEHITVDGIGNGMTACGNPLMVGIYYLNVSGTITQNALRNQIEANPADQGCQNGLGIYVESGDGGLSTTTISNNTVHNYQKNGITVNGFGDSTAGPVTTIENNTVIGAGSTNGAAENGIQLGFGATGKITGNTTIDDIWAPDTSSDTGDAAAGILVFGTTNNTVSNNSVGSTQFGIYIGDNNDTVTANKVIGTRIFDGIDVCGNSNIVTSNVINSSSEAAIHLDDSCGGTGNGNTVKSNSINEACAGILTGTGTSGNTTTPNTMFNVVNSVLSGDSCTTLQTEGTDSKSAARSAKRPRISPYPARKTGS